MLPKEGRIKELLRQKGLDGAIVSSPENFHYVTGFGGHQHTVSRQPGFSVAVVSAREDVPTQLTTMDFEVPTFEKKSAGRFIIKKYDTWVGLKTWDEIANGAMIPPPAVMESSLDVVKKMVREMDLADKKLGLEMEYLPVLCYNDIAAAFPEAKLENISDLFVFARSVKTPEEIEMFRTLCRVADEGFTAVSKIAKPGVSERELVETFRRTVNATGLAVPSAWSMFSTGESGSRLTLPGDGVIQKGDVVKFDAGVNAEFDFYTTDTSRSWVMEGADPVLYKLKDRLYEGLQRMIAAAKPGLPICDLYHVAYD